MGYAKTDGKYYSTRKKTIMTKRKEEPKFKVGDIVRCLKTLQFIDRSYHIKDFLYYVTDSTLEYYNIVVHNYEFVKSSISPKPANVTKKE